MEILEYSYFRTRTCVNQSDNMVRCSIGMNEDEYKNLNNLRLKARVINQEIFDDIDNYRRLIHSRLVLTMEMDCSEFETFKSLTETKFLSDFLKKEEKAKTKYQYINEV